MKVTLLGEFDQLEHSGDVISFLGTVLVPGTFQGIDGNRITYPKEIVEKCASTGNGTQLVNSHHDGTRGSVIGFNTATWFDGNSLRNKGYIFDPATVELIRDRRYPMGQSMEATVQAEEGVAKSFSIDVVMVGVEKPACELAKVEETKEVKLEEKKGKMSESENAGSKGLFEGIEEELKASVKDEALLSSIMAILRKRIKVPYPYPKPAQEAYMAMPDVMFAEMKTDMEKLKTVGALEATVKKLQEDIDEMKKKKEEDEECKMVADIKTLNSEFDSVKFLEGIDNHSIKSRMLKTLLSHLEKSKEILPPGTETNGDNKDLAETMFGVKEADLMKSLGLA